MTLSLTLVHSVGGSVPVSRRALPQAGVTLGHHPQPLDLTRVVELDPERYMTVGGLCVDARADELALAELDRDGEVFRQLPAQDELPMRSVVIPGKVNRSTAVAQTQSPTWKNVQ